MDEFPDRFLEHFFGYLCLGLSGVNSGITFLENSEQTLRNASKMDFLYFDGILNSR